MRWLVPLSLASLLVAGNFGAFPPGIGLRPGPLHEDGAGAAPLRTTADARSDGTFGETRALAGDRILIDATRMDFASLICPRPETAEGRKAKALMATFLRAGDVLCRMTSWNNGPWRGDRTVNGKDVAAGMKRSGLCR